GRTARQRVPRGQGEDMSYDMDLIVRSLELEETAPDRYLGTHTQPDFPVVYGGQLMAQILVAAARGAGGKTVRNLQIAFAKPASPSRPVEIAVDTMHDGRGMGSKTITITQGDTLCCRAITLLSADAPDLIRHADRPTVTSSPEECKPWPTDLGAWEVRVADGA